MAEIALVGTIIGLVATRAHLGVKLANFVEAIKDAPESILDVKNELEGVNDTLQELKEPIQSQKGHLSQNLAKAVARVTQDCTRVFSKLKKLIERLGRPGSKTSRVLFVVYADNINAARSSLQAQKASLTLIPQLAITRDSSTIVSLIERLLADRDVTAIPTRSQEVARGLLSDVANSIGMTSPIPSLPQTKSVPIEPEDPVPATAAAPETPNPTSTHPQTKMSKREGSTSPATEDELPNRAEKVQDDPDSNPLRRFDTDEPEKETDNGIALVAAAASGDVEMATLLLEFDVSPNSTANGNTPLQAAAFPGHVEAVKLLIQRGANVNSFGGMWGSPLQAGVKGGHAEVVKILLEAGADPDGAAVLVTAASYGNVRCVKSLVNHGANVNIECGGPLQAAAFSGHLEVVKVLLAAGADVGATGGSWGSPLQAAVKGGHIEVVNAVLEAGADANGAAVLVTASSYGNVRCVKSLVNHGANVDIECGGPLQAAAFGGHVEVVKVLLTAGADAGATGGSWGSPIRAAVLRGHKEIARVLMEHKKGSTK